MQCYDERQKVEPVPQMPRLEKWNLFHIPEAAEDLPNWQCCPGPFPFLLA
jgi:hypothetical protein